MRHEGWRDKVDVFDRNAVCNDPDDPWSANCSIPKLLFFGKGAGIDEDSRFEREFSELRILKKARNECFLFFFSGGVIAKTFSLPLGDTSAKFIQKIDEFLIKLLPEIFAGGCSVVLQKR